MALLLLPFVIVLFWLASRWVASHGAGFRFARDKIEDSSALQARIGRVSNVSFPILSHYSAHYGMGYSKIHMELEAKGDRGTANVDMDIAEDDVGTWKIERSSVDGQSMTLDR